jgi:CheY-like chemotaxis protein
MDSIFDEFNQLDHYLTKRIRGTGIGLTITKKIVDFLGGDIQVESKPKIGSIFVVDIPFKECLGKKTEICVKNHTEKNIQVMGTHKILLAEDNEANQFLIKALTKNTDWELTVVDDGEKAVEAYSNDKFDLILMDVQMPVMNGYEATKIIRGLEAEKGYRTPIIALTAFAMTSDKEECINAGMDDYISKPFKRQQFMDAVNQALNPKG